MNIDELLDVMDETLEEAVNLPFTGGKRMVDVEKVRDIIDDIRLNMPAEIRQAKAIVQDRADIVESAKKEAEAIVTRAEDRARAMEVLYSRLAQLEEDKRNAEASKLRHSILSTGDRSDRIRTYNFPQGRVTDHRINLTVYRLDEVLSGSLDLLLKPVIEEFKAEQLSSMAQEGSL